MSRARVAVVTGGSRGIGFEICRQLAELGLRVVLTARDAETARERAAALGSAREVFLLSARGHRGGEQSPAWPMTSTRSSEVRRC